MSDLDLLIRLFLLPMSWIGSWQVGTWIARALNRRDGWIERTEWVRRDNPLHPLYDTELDDF